MNENSAAQMLIDWSKWARSQNDPRIGFNPTSIDYSGVYDVVGEKQDQQAYLPPDASTMDKVAYQLWFMREHGSGNQRWAHRKIYQYFYIDQRGLRGMNAKTKEAVRVFARGWS